jgi:hypothetical protein
LQKTLVHKCRWLCLCRPHRARSLPVPWRAWLGASCPCYAPGSAVSPCSWLATQCPHSRVVLHLLVSIPSSIALRSRFAHQLRGSILDVLELHCLPTAESQMRQSRLVYTVLQGWIGLCIPRAPTETIDRQKEAYACNESPPRIVVYFFALTQTK